jgi:hypothetical protein
VKLGILALILGLIYILLLYAALPLGLLAIIGGIVMIGKARAQERALGAPPVIEHDEDGKPKATLREEGTGLIWLGAVLAVVGAAMNAYRYFGV